MLMAAHFSRADIGGLPFICLLLPFLLFFKRAWVPKVFQVLLILGSIEWIRTMIGLIQMRELAGQPWIRLAVILVCVALFTGLSAMIFQGKTLKNYYRQNNKIES